MSRYDIKRDNELIAAGTHFWCRGHLGAIRIAEQSTKDIRYCVACQQSIDSTKREEKQAKDYQARIKTTDDTPNAQQRARGGQGVACKGKDTEMGMVKQSEGILNTGKTDKARPDKPKSVRRK